MKKTFVLASIVFLLSSCASLVPQKRTEGASIKTSEKLSSERDLLLEKSIEGEKTPVLPTPNITVSGSSNQLNLNISQPTNSNPYRATLSLSSSDKTKASADELASGFFKIQIPLGVTLILLGLGVILCVWAWKYARRSSAAFNALSSVADTSAGQLIGSVENYLRTESDPSKQAMLANMLSDLNKHRGKINSI